MDGLGRTKGSVERTSPVNIAHNYIIINMMMRILMMMMRMMMRMMMMMMQLLMILSWLGCYLGERTSLGS